ncbi:MAG: VWA domain-containing protein [Deltaproteobacteria bacterium]|nr:VWA domain-containing protein [Deltaproteobacteria bacterium]
MSRRMSWISRGWFLGLALGAVVVLAPSAWGLDLFFLNPPPDKPVFGEIEVVMEVLGADQVKEVVLLVDGRPTARFTKPPYRWVVDLGQANREHRFEGIVRTVSGEEVRSVRQTRAIAVNEAVDLALQQLYVTVSRGGKRLTNLSRGYFKIKDNGRSQSIVTFEDGNAPLTAALLVDASSSMKGDRLRLAVRGARRFAEGMAELDEAALLLFSDRLLHATDFTGNAADLVAGLDGVKASGGTAIHDHLYLALKHLEGRQGRRVAVLLTDGTDVESALSMEDIQWTARRSQTLIYWIRILQSSGGAGSTSSWRNADNHRQERHLLEQVVEASGGRIVHIGNLGEAETAFSEILRELREQYVLGYYPSENRGDGSWHRVHVDAGPEVEVRTREGYLDY